MSPMQRAKLTRNIDYHSSVAAHYREESKKEKEAAPAAAHGRGAAPPKPAQSAADKLAEMHDDVVKQLTDVLNADPPINTVEETMLSPRPLRRQGSELKPDAGWFVKPVLH